MAPTPPPTPSQAADGRLWQVEAAAVALMVLTLWVASFTAAAVFDDAFMFVRYARNLWAGHGHAWNPGGPPVDGLTSPLWLAVVWATLPWATPDAIASGAHLATLSLASAGVLLVVLWLAARALLAPALRPLAVLAPALLLVGPLRIDYLAVTGMETMLAAALLTLFVALMIRLWPGGGSPRMARLMGPVGLGALGFLCHLARPEFGLVAVLTPALLWRKCRRISPGCARAAVLCGATVISLLGLWLLLHLLWFGSLFPLPFHVKGFLWRMPYEDFSPTTRAIVLGAPFQFVQDGALLIGPLVLGLARRRRWRSLVALWLPLALTLIYLSAAFQVMGSANRYYFPLLGPAVLLLIPAWGLDAGAPRGLPPRGDPAVRAVPVLALAVFALILTGLLIFPQRQARHRIQSPRAPHTLIAERFQMLPAGASVAATEVGLLGALNPQLIIHDLAGLNDPEFARGFDADALFRRQPDVITLVHGDYQGMVRRILAHPRFGDYRLLWDLTPGRAGPYLDTAVYVNTASPRRAVIERILAPGGR